MAELPETKAGEKQYLTLSRVALAILRDLPRNGSYVFCWLDGRPFTRERDVHSLELLGLTESQDLGAGGSGGR